MTLRSRRLTRWQRHKPAAAAVNHAACIGVCTVLLVRAGLRGLMRDRAGRRQVPVSVPDMPAGTGRPGRRPGWVVAGVAFAAIHGPRPVQDRRPGRDRARPARRPGAEARWRVAGVVALVLFAWVLPLAIAVTMVGLGATEMDQSIRAADGQGIPGVVVPTDENCGGDPPCSWTGNFTSSGGRLRLMNIDISGGAQEVGKPFRGLYEGSAFIENQVYPYGSHQWIWDIGFLIFGAMMLGLAAGVTIAWRRTRRRPAIPQGIP